MFLECVFVPLPGGTERRELTSGYSLPLALICLRISMERHALPHVLVLPTVHFTRVINCQMLREHWLLHETVSASCLVLSPPDAHHHRAVEQWWLL